MSDYIYFKFGDSNDLQNRKECDQIVDIMVSNGLISSPNDYNYTIRPEGIAIFENGGWKKYKFARDQEAIKEEQVRSREIEKLVWETKLIKWQVKSFWPLFIIALLGAIMGSISLFWQIIEKK